MPKWDYDKDAVIARLKGEKAALEAQVAELKYVLHDIQTINSLIGAATECGCVVIEGIRTSAAYQDFVGVLLANNYAVEIIPVDGNRKLKIIIKESEV